MNSQVKAYKVCSDIVIRWTFEALHQWSTIRPEAECQFLSSLHRHVFHVEMVKAVSHDDRQIEFLEFKRKVAAQFKETVLEKCQTVNGLPVLPTRISSCEQIARYLLTEHKCSKVSVFEDNENGAVVYWSMI